jgi:hypothetical protein
MCGFLGSGLKIMRIFKKARAPGSFCVTGGNPATTDGNVYLFATFYKINK